MGKFKVGDKVLRTYGHGDLTKVCKIVRIGVNVFGDMLYTLDIERGPNRSFGWLDGELIEYVPFGLKKEIKKHELC